jgi:hypothetical protein
MLVADNHLLACICFLTAKPMDTEVIRVVKTPSVPGILRTMVSDLLGNRCRILTEKPRDIFKRCTLIQCVFNVLSVLKCQMFLITGY